MDESPFNKLSAELRNKIYELVLSSPNAICINMESDQGTKISAITRVSKQIRKETVLLYRNVNSFVYHFGYETWSHLSWTQENAIKKFTVYMSRWLNSQPRSRHQATRCLTIRFGVGPFAWDRFWDHNLHFLMKVAELIRSSGYESHQILFELWIPRYPRQARLVYSLKAISCLGVPFRLVTAHDGYPYSITNGTAQDGRL